MKAKFSLLALSVAVAALAEGLYIETPVRAGSRRRPKIIGGQEVSPHSIPYQVGLFMPYSFCGGTLITKRYVLTAAHCGQHYESITVVLGAHRIYDDDEPDRVTMKSKRIIVHEAYNYKNLRNDIGLIELPEDAPLNEYIQLIKLAAADGESYAGVTCETSGWGVVYQGSNGLNAVLKSVESNILSNEDCQTRFGEDVVVVDTIICFNGTLTRNPCNGDSGGPLVIRTEDGPLQVGLTSFSSVYGCEAGYPSGYTRLSHYIHWIANHSDYQR